MLNTEAEFRADEYVPRQSTQIPHALWASLVSLTWTRSQTREFIQELKRTAAARRLRTLILCVHALMFPARRYEQRSVSVISMIYHAGLALYNNRV